MKKQVRVKSHWKTINGKRTRVKSYMKVIDSKSKKVGSKKTIGKRCEKCGGKLRRGYTRSFHKGTKFMDVKPYFIENAPKSRLEPFGWICDDCGHIKFDDDNFWQRRGQEERDQHSKDLEIEIQELKQEIKENKDKFDKYKYTQEDMDKEEEWNKRFMMRRFWSIKGVLETISYLRGLKEGRKISDEHWKEVVEREKLTDEQILKKAEVIEIERKLGIRK